MNPLSVLVAVIFTLATCSCSRRHLTIPIDDHLSGIGSIQSPKGNWIVSFLPEDPGLKITNLKSPHAAKEFQKKPGSRFSTSVGPSTWRSSANAFAYIDSDDRVWAFDGTDQIFILEPIGTDGSGRVVGYETWRKPVPPEFSKRLPAKLVK